MYPKKFYRLNSIRALNGRCFVIMPFANEFDEIYEIIKEAVEAAEVGFICRRADEHLAGSPIMEDVLEGVGESEIIIADLTGRNPNVFYELGVAHMVKDADKVIMLTQDIESVPYDLRPYRTIEYKQTIEGAKKLKADLLKAFGEIAEHSFLFEVKDNEKYKFPQKLLGEGNYLYDFEIKGFFGFNSGKLELGVTRYGINDPVKEVFRNAYGLRVGEIIPIPKIPWELILEKVSSTGTATFCLVPIADELTQNTQKQSRSFPDKK